jgi:PPOX class probable F420-dependent enzyme
MVTESLAGFWEARRVAILATVRRDGTIHQVPVRCMREGDRFLVLTAARSVKARNVAHASRASLAEQTDDRWATVEGPAFVSRDPELLTRARAAYQGRHLGPGTFGDCVIVVEAERVMHGW